MRLREYYGGRKEIDTTKTCKGRRKGRIEGLEGLVLGRTQLHPLTHSRASLKSITFHLSKTQVGEQPLARVRLFCALDSSRPLYGGYFCLAFHPVAILKRVGERDGVGGGKSPKQKYTRNEQRIKPKAHVKTIEVNLKR